MSHTNYKLIPETFTAVPSRLSVDAIAVVVDSEVSGGLESVGYLVGQDTPVPPSLGLDRDALARTGFEGKAGQSLVIPSIDGAVLLAVGTGQSADFDAARLRDAAAVFARAASHFARIGLVVGETSLNADLVGQVVTEGSLLARYSYSELKSAPDRTRLISLDIVVDAADVDATTRGAHDGEIIARAANVARDLANTPPGHLTASDLADVAVRLGDEHGFGVEVFDREQLIELGCGGLLGVNAGSVEEPRMVKLTYRPEGSDDETPHLVLVGKGITYDSGGLSLKPSDEMHLAMKMDMAGAGAVLATLTSLQDLAVPVRVTAYLMCTDNMPSGSATKLGDVLTLRGGTTVEVKNTDAEGRLVLSDALALARESEPDAIVDIATLTGAALMALGPLTAAVLGNDQPLIDQLKGAAEVTDETLWQLPLEHRYRKQLDSEVADIANLGGKYAGSITAALFLAEFVGEIPWAHLDIAGTMKSDTDDVWRSRGATGYGTRLLIELTRTFTPTRG